jgi:serine/threonine-protein kinase ULK4
MIDGNGTLKLGDFGLSKLEGETLEEIFQETVDASYKPNNIVISPKSNKTLFGEPNYLAPEIINGDEHTKMSDLWSIGVILYELYAGHTPFMSDNLDQLVEKITVKDLPNPKGTFLHEINLNVVLNYFCLKEINCQRNHHQSF